MMDINDIFDTGMGFNPILKKPMPKQKEDNGKKGNHFIHDRSSGIGVTH